MQINDEKEVHHDQYKSSNELYSLITKPSQLGPMAHPSLEGMYRVVLWPTSYDPEYAYTMCVGEGYMRMYTEDTLPIDIRMKIVAIDSFIEGMIAKGEVHPMILNKNYIQGSQTGIYANDLSKDLDGIGWRYGDYYCLVMSEEELRQYKGNSA